MKSVKHTRIPRILSLVLCAAMLFLALPTALFAAAEEKLAAPKGLEDLEGYRHAWTATKDNNVGLSLNVHTYYDSKKEYTVGEVGKPGSVTILYVMNTNTERVGKSDDKTIVSSLLDRGYFVLVLDYLKAEEACGSALDWSVQDIRAQLIGGTNYSGSKSYTAGTFSDGLLTGATSTTAQSYILPAGYDIAYNIPYFAYDLYGTAGVLETIVDVWNNDFKSVKRETLVKWVDEKGVPRLDKTEAITVKSENDKSAITDYAVWFSDENKTGSITQAALAELSDEEKKAYPYTYIGNTKATLVTDCVKPDGSFIDLNLYMDVIYPTGNADAAPVMMCLSSSYTRASSWTSETRPELTGCLFNGYVGIVADYALTPMCRNDHYGYFCGDSQLNSVSGDNATYSLGVYCGIESDTALIRTVRKMGVDGIPDAKGNTLKVAILSDRIGAYGNSKAGVCIRLGEKNPELLENTRHLEGHLGETRYEAWEAWKKASSDDYEGYTDPFISDNKTTDEKIRLPEAQPALTYESGETIPSNLNLVYANCGGQVQSITEGHCPVFGAGTQKPGGDGCSYWSFYRQVMNQCKNAKVPFLGLVAPDAGHDLGHGLDKDYGIDTYEAFHRYCNYWLKDENAECMIIDVDTANDIGVASDVPIDHIYEISETSSIKFQFTGPVDLSEVSKIRIANAVTGDELTGQWSSLFGDQQWKFLPYDIKDGTYYRIEVPNTILAKNGKPLKETKTLLFRTSAGLTETAESTSGSSTLTADGAQYVVFSDADRTAAHKTILRFTVTNDAVNTVEIYAVADYNEADPSSSVLGEKLGEVIVTGAGTYGFDVTEYMRDCKGKAVFRLSAASGASENVLNSYDMEGLDKDASIGGIWCMSTARAYYSDEAPNADGTANTSYKLDYLLRSSQYIDWKNELSGNGIGNPTYFAEVAYGIRSDGKLSSEEDLGRRFVISFRVYDETSRLVSLRMGYGYRSSLGIADFGGEDFSFYTKEGEWVDVSFTMTLSKDNILAAETLSKGILVLFAENKSVATLSDLVAVGASGRADGTSGGNYAGDGGLKNGYTKRDNAKTAEANGEVAVDHDRSYGLYLDDFTFTEVKTEVALAGAPTLSVLPQNTSDALLVEASYVTSADAGSSPSDGSLTIGGGESGFDSVSVKTYLKLSLENYAANLNAGVVFRATGAGEIAVYGIADVAAGQAWTRENITAANAPANDLYGAGVNLSAVWGGAPLGTFTSVAAESVFSLDITDFAKAMKAAGASSVTLVFVSNGGALKEISSYDFEATKPSVDRWTGYTLSEGKTLYTFTDGKFVLTPADVVNPNGNQNLKLLGVFNKIWESKDNIGKTYRITFKASASEAGRLNLSMATSGYAYDENGQPKDANGNSISFTGYKWIPFDGFNQLVDLTTDEKTYSVEFTATADMFPDRLFAADGTTVSGEKFEFALRFYNGFYDAATKAYKDVTITLDDLKVEELPEKVTLSFVEKTPDTVIGESFGVEAAGISWSSFVTPSKSEDGALHLLPGGNGAKEANGGQNIQLTGILDDLWSYDADGVGKYIGKTVRITFRAKSNIAGNLGIGLSSSAAAYTFRDGVCINTNSGSGYRFERFPNATGSAALTEDWQSYSLTFTVTEEMYPHLLMNKDGSAVSGAKLNLCFTMYDTAFLNADKSYNADVDISIDNVKAVVLNGSNPVTYSESYDSGSFTSRLDVAFGWSGQDISRIEGDALVFHPAYDGNAKGNGAQNVQVRNLLDGIFGDLSNAGKTYRILIEAKASDIADGNELHVGITTSDQAYIAGSSDNRKTTDLPGTTGLFKLTTEYQTFVLEFTATADMFPENLLASAGGTDKAVGVKPELSFRFYEGFRGADGTYRDVDISLKSVKIAEVPEYRETSLDTDAVAAVSGGGVSDELAAYPNPDPVEPADIKRAYLTFEVSEISELYEAWLTLTATSAAGQTVTVYAMTDLELPDPLTYENAPLPSGSALTTFRAKLGENRIDLTEWIRANAGHKVTFLLTIEEAGSDVVFDNTTSLPTLTLGTATSDDFDPSSFRVRSNVTLYSDFGYNVYVPAIEEVKEITLDGISHALYELEQKTIGDTVYYVVPFRIAAKEGTDAHTVGVKLNKGGTLLSKSYTVSLPSYAKKLLNDTSASEEAKTVVRDMLSYIDAAMTYFGTSTEAKREKITELIGTEYDGALPEGKLPAAVESTAGLSSACLDLGAIPSFVFYPEDESLAESFEFTANGAYLEKSVKTDATGRVYLEVRTYAYGMLRTLSYTYTDAEGVTQSGSYNLTAYYSGVKNEGTKTLVLHLAKYADSAIAYRNSVIH